MPRPRRGWGMRFGGGAGRRHTPLTVSLLEPALLTLIKNQPNHGYSLLTELQTLGLSTLHPSVVYRTLRDLEELEWIRSDWDTSQTQGPPRRIYYLTTQGEDALGYWNQELTKANEIILHLLKEG